MMIIVLYQQVINKIRYNFNHNQIQIYHKNYYKNNNNHQKYNKYQIQKI